jgi:hypothetical protein
MAGIPWNGRGVRKNGFLAFLKDTIMEYIIECISQETMIKTFSYAFLRKLGRCGKFKWHWLPSRGRSGGILGLFVWIGFILSDFQLVNII